MSTVPLPTQLRVVRLQAENFKRLIAVDITPEGDVVQLTGRNRQGKTSVLDCIWAAIAGRSACPSKPIHEGAEQASIRLDMGEMVVTRSFRLTEDGDFTTSVKVTNAKGVKFPGGPQEVLNQLFSALSFDPLELSKKKPPEQLAVVRELVQKVSGIDFAEIDRLNKADFESRTVVNSEVMHLKARIQALPVVEGLPNEQPIDEEEIVQELANIGRRVALIAQRKAGRDETKRQADAYRTEAAKNEERRKAIAEEIRKLNAESSSLLDTNNVLLNQADGLDHKLAIADTLPEPPSTTEIQKRLEEAKQHNIRIRQLHARNELVLEAQQRANAALSLTRRIEDRKAEIRRAVETSRLPIPGLQLGEDGLLLNNLPFEQASGAEILRTCIAIAMALNPNLHVLRVKDASLLDDEQLAIIYQIAREERYQVWLEVVDQDGSGDVGIVIEDGRVKAVNADPLNLREEQPPPNAPPPRRRRSAP